LPLFGADDDYRVLFISGSGTAGLEAALSSLIPEGAKILIASNGAFGERLHEIALLHRIPTIHLKYAWGDPISLDELEKAADSNPGLWGIVMNHHETSVGRINPIGEVGRFAHSRSLRFLVDAISSLGAEEIDVKRQFIDACVTSSNKCLHSVTGVSMVCVRRELLDGLDSQKPRSYYLDLYRHYRYLEDHNQTPYTPNVTSFFALERAVEELLDEGLEQRKSVYEWRNSFLHKELKRMGFDFLLGPEDNPSITILTVKIPDAIDYRRFYDQLKSYGFLIYDCKPPLAGRYFQIANMGDLDPAMLYDFIFVVKKVLRDMRR
jgi:2-aminoethylphosphonate-pyruvate transaminase